MPDGARTRDLRSHNLPDESLKLTVPDMKRVENLPAYDVAPAGYEKVLRDGAAHVKGTGMPWQRQANAF